MELTRVRGSSSSSTSRIRLYRASSAIHLQGEGGSRQDTARPSWGQGDSALEPRLDPVPGAAQDRVLLGGVQELVVEAVPDLELEMPRGGGGGKPPRGLGVRQAIVARGHSQHGERQARRGR